MRKFICAIGAAYGLFVWSVAERFGGRYVPGTTTDLGAAIIYSLVFYLSAVRSMSVDRPSRTRSRPNV